MQSIRGGTEAPPFWLLTNKMKNVPPPMGLGEDGAVQRGDDVV